MPSFCQDLKTSYEHLMKLSAEFAAKYSVAKESGDLQEVRRLRKDLETARDALLERLAFFTVPDAKNPYHEALLEAGLDPTKTEEQERVLIDIRKEIQRQLAVYTDTKDDSENPCLEEWVKNITESEYLIYRAAAQDRANIIERIKAGMIPVVMPGRDVQIKTWKATLLNLKPIWMRDGVKRILHGAHIDYTYEDETMKMTEKGFFKNIPDRPYLVWVKPTQKPDPKTLSKSFDEQQVFHASLVNDYPQLYDSTDLIPTEYIALQAVCSASTQRQFEERADGKKRPENISPLDFRTYTRFLSAGRFSDGRLVPCALFVSNGSQMGVRYARDAATTYQGFRPASRT